MKHIKYLLISFLIISAFSCNDENNNEKLDQAQIDELTIPKDFFAEVKVPGVAENVSSLRASAPPVGFDPNNGDDQVLLGNQLTNPYTVLNMQNAINILYGGSGPVLVATHKYIRFKPNSVEQIEELEDNQDLELQDYPMDYEVIQDGDYYQDPSLGSEDIGWLYSVVPINYAVPSGIPFEIITELFLTENSILEDIAESLASGIMYSSYIIKNGTVSITRSDNGENISFRLPNPCEFDEYPCTGGGGGGGGGIPPTIDAGIFVQEQLTCGQPISTVPLRQARVIAKRWFKIWKGYTDDNGDFTVTKKFKNKVKVIVKTKNNNAKVCKVRGIRLWQMLFPAKKRIGVFNNNELANIRYVFAKPTDGNAHNKELAYWSAATTHNSVVEFRQYCNELGLPLPPSNLKIMVTNWGFMRNSGAAPMWNKSNNNVVPTVWTTAFIVSNALGGYITGGIIAIANILKNQTDVIIGYTSNDYNCLLTSPQLRSTVYHELGHTQHFGQAQTTFWDGYRSAITAELISSGFSDPYGDGQNANRAPIIATGEMWGNHCEKWFSERHYGVAPTNVLSISQRTFFVNDGSPIATYNGINTVSIPNFNANFAAIESYNPTLTGQHDWIPQGLPYDLWDNRNDAIITDNANGFSINQCYNALQPDVQSIPQFRERLLQQNGFIQQAQVNQLFQQYGF